MTMFFSSMRICAMWARIVEMVWISWIECSMNAVFSVLMRAPPATPTSPTSANIASTIAIAPRMRVRIEKPRISVSIAPIVGLLRKVSVTRAPDQ
jgi:hypothetical protein